MIRKLLCMLGLICTTTISSQGQVGQFKNSLKTSGSNIKDVFPIVDQKTGELAMFIADAKNVYGYKLNEKFEVLDQLSSEEKMRKYKLLIGNSVNSNGDYLVYLSNKSKKKFLSLTFSFNSKSTTLKEFTFESRDERLLQTINNNNQFYILSFNFYKDDIYIYTFDEEGNAKRNRLDFSEFEFISSNSRRMSFKKMVVNHIGEADLQKFNENDPQSIEAVSVPRKMYIKEGKVTFTFDQNTAFTQIATLDLASFKTDAEIYKKPLLNVPSTKKKSNSYVNGDYLFMSSASKDAYELEIVNYKTKQMIKTYRIEKDKPIDFKNSPIIQEGGAYAGYREMEKSKKFLRKVYNGDIGVSVLKRNNNYEVTLGGFIEKNTGGMMVPGFGIPIASTGNVTIFFNPAALAYNSYSATKSTRIECLFDANFNHTKGDILDNAFDKMSIHSTFSSKATESVFRYRDYYLKGFYNAKNKLYSFRKYKN